MRFISPLFGLALMPLTVAAGELDPLVFIYELPCTEALSQLDQIIEADVRESVLKLNIGETHTSDPDVLPAMRFYDGYVFGFAASANLLVAGAYDYIRDHCVGSDAPTLAELIRNYPRLP